MRVEDKGHFMKTHHGVALILSAILLTSCQEKGMEILRDSYASLDAISQDNWDALARKKIFFGHKSVGANILEGIREVLGQRPAIKLEIRETTEPDDFAKPVFAHAPIGKNKEPLSKLERFKEIMASGVGRAADIAFFKFCFIDIDHSTDIDSLFESTVKLTESLERQFPSLKIVPFTVPLLSRPVGLKARLEKFLGRLPWYEEDNVRRNQFNDKLRARFKGALFDLASIESRIDGQKKATFRADGKTYELLYRPYTDDGGHLNPVGRQIVAIELLKKLAHIENR